MFGGSLGGTDAFKKILKQLPSDFKHPIVYIFHQKIKGLSFLKEIQSLSSLEVIEIQHNTSVTPGKIFISPSNKHVLISSRLNFILSNSPEVHFCRPSIDVSFKSLAYSLKEKAICILLSGSNKDGAKGVSYILNQGGLAFIQSPGSAFSPRMPQSALDLNPSLLGLSLENITQKLKRL